MPAEFERGFSVREAMWHGLGVVPGEYPGRDEAMTLAGHRWTVDRRPLGLLPEGTDLGTAPDGSRIASGPVRVIEGHDALVRSDTGAVLSVMRPTYEVVQNDELWDLLDALVGDPRVRYETAGTLREGRTVWAMARVEGDWRVPGDESPLVPYLTVVNWHDGTGALRALRNGVRVVCMNTVNMALAESERAGRQWTFRHTGDVLDRIDEARAAIDGIAATADEFVALATDLTKLKVKDEGRRLFLERFGPTRIDDLATDRAAANAEDARRAVLSILNGETGTLTAAQGATAYGLFEAGVEYLDHVRPARSPSSRFQRALIEPSDDKAHVLGLAREAARV
jgi:phage/plasmid-like protein (TIGR03299 family)